MSLATVFSLLLDVMLIGLLGVTIAYVLRLNRRISVLHQSRAEIEKLVQDFGAIVMRAEAGVNNLKLAAEESGYALEKQIERATYLREEMHFMIQTADQLAERITQMALHSRPEPKDGRKEDGRKETAGREAVSKESSVSAAIEQAIGKAASGTDASSVAAPKVAGARATGTEGASAEAPRSRAERDLLQAIERLK